MKVVDYLIEELNRLNRINDRIEKDLNKASFIENEPELIVKNVLAMCEIAKTIKDFG